MRKAYEKPKHSFFREREKYKSIDGDKLLGDKLSEEGRKHLENVPGDLDPTECPTGFPQEGQAQEAAPPQVPGGGGFGTGRWGEGACPSLEKRKGESLSPKKSP